MTTPIYKEFQEPPQDGRVRSRHSNTDIPIFAPYPDARCQQCNDKGSFKQIWFNCAGKAVERDMPCFYCDAANKGE